MTNEINNEIKQSNSLVYKTNKIVGDEHIYVTIHLNDQCKNGHQDFSITANIYEAGKPTIDKYFISGGCCHEEILKAFPEFKIFVDLHLCDYLGNPMYAVGNGYYHLTEGFSKEKKGTPEFKQKYCEYYRITPYQFDVLEKSFSKVHFAMLLQGLNIPKQWEQQADEAIKILEELTQTKFIIDSKRTQLDIPTEEEIKAELERIESGYYSIEQITEREEEKKRKEFEALDNELNEKIKALRIEYEVKKALLTLGPRFLEHSIYYDHTREIKFNWRSYGNQLTPEEIERAKKTLVLPEGVTFHK